jgi:hypothetical protein
VMERALELSQFFTAFILGNFAQQSLYF